MLFRMFVYGALKRGEQLHHLLNSEDPGCTYAGDAVTAERYPLVVSPTAHVPFLLYRPREGHNIEGQIFEVDEEHLEALDKLEKNTLLYDRLQIDVKPLNSDGVAMETTTKCWCYFLIKYRPALLDLPFKKTYTDGEGQFKYVGTKDRPKPGPKLWSEVHIGYSPDQA